MRQQRSQSVTEIADPMGGDTVEEEKSEVLSDGNPSHGLKEEDTENPVLRKIFFVYVADRLSNQQSEHFFLQNYGIHPGIPYLQPFNQEY